MKLIPSMCEPPDVQRAIHINLNDPAQCDAVFEAKDRAHLMELLRLCDHSRDNAEAQRDHEQERNEGWSVR
jgi:hypothetical protein